MPRNLLNAVLITLVVAACSTDGSGESAGPAGQDRPLVVTTTTILGDISENIVGDLADVEVIMPVGADPHDFEPSGRQAAQMREADLIIANGLSLEEGLHRPLEQAAAEGIPVLEVAPEVDPISSDEASEHSHDNGHSHHGYENPHFWMDPSRVGAAASLIAEELASHSDLDPEILFAQADSYVEELTQLDGAVEEIFSEIPAAERRMVTNHDAFSYLADRYGFEILGTVVPRGTTLAEPSAGALVELAELIEEQEVPAIFTETISPTDLAETLAAETGVDVQVVELFSDSLGQPGTAGDTYTSMMITNAERIVEALT